MKALKEFRKVNNLTQEQLSDYLGDIGKSFVSQIEHGGRKLPAEQLAKLLNNDRGWDTSMLADDAQQVAVPQMSAHYVPVLPVAATAGKLSDYSVGVGPRDCEYSISPIAGADMIIPVLGESMAPEYGNGSRVVVKRINDKAFIEWGKVYVLDTENGAVLKEIHKGASDDELVCVSLNPDPKYAEFTVKREDVRGMYRVLMCMSLK